MAKVTNSMIHPELRKKAKTLGRSKNFSLFTLKIIKRSCRLLRGRHSRKMCYDQKYIIRPDGTKLRICVYSPLVPHENVPGILWIHGGGYAIGIPEQDDNYIRGFVEASGCVVVSPDYTLSLDRPYPAALEDCYAALTWLSDNAESLGVRTDQLFVGGDSAGGGLAAALVLYARDKGEIVIAFQMLLYPMLDDRPTESSTDNDAPVWGSVSNIASWKLYLGDLFDTDAIPAYAVPGRTTSHAGLPPTFSFVGSIEPFHDETVIFMDNLKKSGVPVHFRVFDGCFHAFDQICRKTDIAGQAKAFLMESYDYAVHHYFSPQMRSLS